MPEPRFTRPDFRSISGISSGARFPETARALPCADTNPHADDPLIPLAHDVTRPPAEMGLTLLHRDWQDPLYGAYRRIRQVMNAAPGVQRDSGFIVRQPGPGGKRRLVTSHRIQRAEAGQ
jgi:hypothetical protein